MDCSPIERLLDPYLDDELDPARAASVRTHLEGCCACRRVLDAMSSLRTTIRTEAPYHRAPPELAMRIRETVGRESQEAVHIAALRTHSPRWNRWFQLGAAVFAAVVVSTSATLLLTAPDPEWAIAEQVINGHARSALTGRPMEVASSDRHAVKPWLSSRLDFSPPVVDLTTAGFPLRGGRLDYAAGRPVAVLVYAHRQHVIDLYVWPGAKSRSGLDRTRTFTRNGFNVVHWTDPDMTYWAISDLNSADLEAFASNYKTAK
jgi:anti-sigma factor RsiW